MGAIGADCGYRKVRVRMRWTSQRDQTFLIRQRLPRLFASRLMLHRSHGQHRLATVPRYLSTGSSGSRKTSTLLRYETEF